MRYFNLLDLGFSDYEWRQFWSCLPIILIATAVVGLLITVIVAGSNYYKDDNRPLEKIKGKVVENCRNVKGIQLIVIESTDGERKRLRNVKDHKLFVYEGDEGTFEYRGETLYDFISDKSAKKAEESIKASEWKCPNCGTVNKNYVGTCSCGTRKQ